MTDTKIKHIAFIMDGNGRWAQKRGLPRESGHVTGARVFSDISEYCGSIGINCVTFYALSTENWKRPKREIDAILKLFSEYIERAAKTLNEKDIRLVFLGDRAPFGETFTRRMNELEKLSENNSKILNIAMNYGGRAEIVKAVNELIAEGKTEVSDADISAHLYTKLSPEPDLIVRTGCEKRISNFLIWQSAYSELYFTDVLWPDFSASDVDAAIAEFYRRQRRFGGVIAKEDENK